MQRKTRRKRILWIGLAVLAALLLILFLRPHTQQVEAAKVTRGDLVLDLSTTGVVEGDVADVAPRIVGRVTGVLVDEGDSVSRGQVVARLDDSELRADVDRARSALLSAQSQASAAANSLIAETRQVNAQIARARAALSASRARLAELQAGSRPQQIREAEAALRQAEAQARNARADLERSRQLFSKGAIAKSQLDTAETAADVAESTASAARERLALLREGTRSEQIAAARADVRSAEAALAEAQAGRSLLDARREEVQSARAQVEQAHAVLDAAQARLNDAVIKSPVDGPVVRKHVEVGETASPQQPVVTIARSGPVWVTAEVDQEEVAAITEGQSVRISLEAYPGRYTEGVVTSVSTVAVPKDVGRVRAKVVRARISITKTAFPLRPGMEVDIDGKLKVADNVLLVPNDAVIRIGDKDIVYTISGSTAHRRKITPGLSNFDYTIVREGLRKGETVATTEADKLNDGTRVRIVEAR